MSHQSLDPEQNRNAKRLQIMADGLRQARQQRNAPTTSQPRGYRVVQPRAKDIDSVPIIEDSDYYFVTDLHGRSPFYLTPKPDYFDDYEQACRTDQIAALQHVISHHALTPAVLHHGLTLALAAGSEDCVRELLHRGSPITHQGAKEVLSAPRDKQTACLDTLAAGGTWRPSHDIFMRAIPDVELMNWFLSHGVHPNYGINKQSIPSHQCGEALEKAACLGSAQAIEALVAAGAKVEYGVPLHFAAGAKPPEYDPYSDNGSQTEHFDESRIPAMAALVAHGADVNARDDVLHANFPGYPLLYAVRVGAVRRARWLLEHGADPNRKGDSGSAADYASSMGSKEMKDLFESWRDECNARNALIRSELDPVPSEDEERKAVISREDGFHLRPPPPPHCLGDSITADDDLFQTIHMGAVVVDRSKWSLVVTGMVSRPFSIDLPRLKSLPSRTIKSFHECFGSPLKPATTALWRVGNVHWTGVSLRLLLELAEVSPNGSFIWSEGLDSGQFGGISADRYQKDLPIDEAMQGDVLVAWEMNGQPLSIHRGGPVRLIVPGWFGTNSTKWLSKVSVQDRRSPGPFTTTFYNEHHPPDDPTCESRPVWKVQPNSLIVKPKPEERIEGPAVSVEGRAWSNDGVVGVEVSGDDGSTWIHATVQTRQDFRWQSYHAVLDLSPGKHTVVARATGRDGRMQPLQIGRNHVHRVICEVT